jgi:predicted helicase
MSIYAIKTYLKELEDLKHYGGTSKETAIRFAFHKLLDSYAASKDLRLVAEISLKTKSGKTVTPDGTLKDQLRLDWGYWESKDESDDINEEIQKKFAKGYPNDNILFEDSVTAVLIQHGDEEMRVPMEDETALDKLLTKFISYQRKEIIDFREAINKFREDIPKVTEAIREIIDKQFTEKNNAVFNSALYSFHELCKQSINPDITEDDLKEMMVQHIITADIFNTIFDEPHFHQENNIARELNKVIETFFTGTTRRQTLGGIKHYYDTINAAAAGIADHHEKQKFLKVVYENFYKAYNPKAADRLGIVYTPNEIVQFMIKSTDYLLHKHFGKVLADKNVEILDPATGTGTFICDIIDYLPKKNIEYKYKNEIHANELAILPYYIANLNIEYTYKQKTGHYAEFENLCFVDTLDNTGFHWVGKQGDLFGMSAENAVRIKKQNEKKISVIIGNPPYNANQQNENDNNKNREYPTIDKRIKETFIKNSTAQKTKLYDMYSRFYRWAMDRLTENGVIAFITNRSFIDSRTFDGFRKSIQQDFDYAYIIDTKSDVRANPKIAGTTHNVFGIQAGVAVLFLVKSSAGKIKHNCKIEYIAMEDEWRKEEKLHWFTEHPIEKIEFENVVPDKNNNWINMVENDWENLIPVASKDVKTGKGDGAIFKNTSLGIATNRDEWVYDYNEDSLGKKISFFANKFNSEVTRWFESDKSQATNDFVSREIKWTEELESQLKKKTNLKFSEIHIKECSFRPFVKKNIYYDKIIIHRFYQQENFYPINSEWENKTINVHCISADHPLSCLSTNLLCDLGYLKQGNGGTFSLPYFTYDKAGTQTDNITDWGLQQFTNHYKKTIAKQDVFHYVYAVLHHPAYRKKYELNLKREFPRIPLYDDFWQWAKWGEQLMHIHLNYEKATPYQLKRVDEVIDLAAGAKFDNLSKAKLKADKAAGFIAIDSYTVLKGIPSQAWEYKLGNRSALEWILDQYKEKTPGDPTIAEKFNTYKFADYKEQVIDLLLRVCTVSAETINIIQQMQDE